MKKFLVVTCVMTMAACGSPQVDEEAAAVEGAETATEVMSLKETFWTFTQDGTDLFESIDADGNYIADAGDEHFDHGTYELVDGKQCFTSAMNDEGQVCWTTPAQIAVGESVDITSDQGEELTVTRVEYEALTM